MILGRRLVEVGNVGDRRRPFPARQPDLILRDAHLRIPRREPQLDVVAALTEDLWQIDSCVLAYKLLLRRERRRRGGRLRDDLPNKVEDHLAVLSRATRGIARVDVAANRARQLLQDLVAGASCCAVAAKALAVCRRGGSFVRRSSRLPP